VAVTPVFLAASANRATIMAGIVNAATTMAAVNQV
jgi:hypothetical protein